MGKSLFQILNLAIFFVSLATLIFGVYCLAKNGHFNPFSYTTIGLGCVLSVTSATLLSQGFKSKCKVGLHLFFLAALLVAECAGIIMYYDQECMVEGMVCKAWLIKQVPHNLQDAIESHMFIARCAVDDSGGRICHAPAPHEAPLRTVQHDCAACECKWSGQIIII